MGSIIWIGNEISVGSGDDAGWFVILGEVRFYVCRYYGVIFDSYVKLFWSANIPGTRYANRTLIVIKSALCGC